MAGRSNASAVSAHHSREDQEWLARFARHEDTSVHVLVDDAVHYFRNWQEKGKHALGEMLDAVECACAEYEKQTRLLRYFQRECQLQSRRLHDMRCEYEEKLRAREDRNPLYSPRVARLLALAVCSASDSEASAAFAKARALHHRRPASR